MSADRSGPAADEAFPRNAPGTGTGVHHADASRRRTRRTAYQRNPLPHQRKGTTINTSPTRKRGDEDLACASDWYGGRPMRTTLAVMMLAVLPLQAADDPV